MMHKFIWKVILTGAGDRRYLMSKIAYNSDVPATSKILRKRIRINNSSDVYNIDLMLNDIDPGEINDSIAKTAAFIIVAANITDKSTLDESIRIIKSLNGKNVYIIALGDDEKYRAEFYDRELETLNNMVSGYYITSLKYDIEPVIERIVNNAIERMNI
ncbi:hypothetical protein [Picrophilus oshimae]|uniref:Uncharacterized protein n=1 Tax=Picrophilus torridus (strain ATCC 700027 / DSM 9790 / JCM 10055 / NBRC 100828 / KAW 2/3) TaxID=1122961 RepID=Q6L1P8_PICTO|nr:hypothetical protein [Picrophilus oshimae]AAT43104.1 hypothetical protein PTO0519 [Picrophilus oshimae DSM 9789]